MCHRLRKGPRVIIGCTILDLDGHTDSTGRISGVSGMRKSEFNS